MAKGIVEKRKHDIQQYQILLSDIEKWLQTVKPTLSSDIQPMSVGDIKDQLAKYEVSL